MDALEKQVEEARREIASDGYPMSIGELTSMYRDGELIIRPEFQRLYRWTSVQKSRLVESILLGIPLPSIFVAQTQDGKWELVDGLQRVSTILQLQNELRDENGALHEPLVLEETKYLNALEGRQWEHSKASQSIPRSIKLDIKRSKIDVKILKRESSPETKFDLFQRLNSFGSILTAQEVRSALLVGASPEFFAWLQELSEYPAFKETVLLPEGDLEVRYDLELVLRFLILHVRPEAKLTLGSLRNLPVILDDESLEMAKVFPKQATRLAETFKTTFEVILERGGSDLFSRWDQNKKSFRGSFLNTAFEVFALGVGYYVATNKPFREDLIDASKELWRRADMKKGFATGKSTEARLARFIPLGRSLLALAGPRKRARGR